MRWTKLMAWSGLYVPCSALADGYFARYFQDCPTSCRGAGSDSGDWTQIHSLKGFKRCQEPMLFGLNLHNAVDDANTVLTIRACAVAASGNSSSTSTTKSEHERSAGDALTVSEGCGAKKISRRVVPTVGGAFRSIANKETALPDSGHIADAVQYLVSHVESSESCGSTIIFSKTQSAIVGVYAGSQVAKSSVSTLLSKFAAVPSKGSLQVCGANVTAALSFGVFAAGANDLASVRSALRAWSQGTCQTGNSPLAGVDMDVLVATLDKSASAFMASNSSTFKVSPRSMNRRDFCRTWQVQIGDSCASLASNCGISVNDFMTYNPKDRLCSTLQDKQFVCCSAGDLPDPRPQPGADGTCNVYDVQDGDGCRNIADAHYLRQRDIEDFNNNTWGWMGCNRLQRPQRICLSKGDAPMPPVIPGAACRPQADVNPTAQKPPKDTPLESLNPCPLNACCDVWGFCGTTAEFCTTAPADRGAPGTTQPGKASCISNCEMNIVRNSTGPAKFMQVGYYEAFNYHRPCLTMSPSSIDTSKYSHIHFAFATVTPSFEVIISDV